MVVAVSVLAPMGNWENPGVAVVLVAKAQTGRQGNRVFADFAFVEVQRGMLESRVVVVVVFVDLVQRGKKGNRMVVAVVVVVSVVALMGSWGNRGVAVVFVGLVQAGKKETQEFVLLGKVGSWGNLVVTVVVGGGCFGVQQGIEGMKGFLHWMKVRRYQD